MDKEIKAQWLTALRSGEYEQGRTALRIDRVSGSSFCCLGVLCDLAEKAGITEYDAEEGGYDRREYEDMDGETSAYVETAGLPTPVMQWAGLDSDCGSLGDPIKGFRQLPWAREEYHASSLIALNDVLEYDFNQIADVIEERF